MILHPGDMYLRGGTQVHPGSLKFWKSAFKLGVGGMFLQVFTGTAQFRTETAISNANYNL